MTKATDAADAIRRLAKQFENMQFAADVLEKIGSMENAFDEAGKSRAAAEAARDQALADKLVAESELAATKAKSKEIVAQAEKRREQILADVDAESDKRLADASERANAAIQSATEQAHGIREDANRQKAAVTLDVQALRDESEQLEAANNAKRAEADAIEARLAKAQAKIAKLLGD